jgi:hypothetical protein
MKILFFIFSICLASAFATNTPEQYIALYKNDAIKEEEAILKIVYKTI